MVHGNRQLYLSWLWNLEIALSILSAVQKSFFLTLEWKQAFNNVHRWHFLLLNEYQGWVFYGHLNTHYKIILLWTWSRKKPKRILGSIGTSKSPKLEEGKDPSYHSTQGNSSTCTNSTREIINFCFPSGNSNYLSLLLWTHAAISGFPLVNSAIGDLDLNSVCLFNHAHVSKGII